MNDAFTILIIDDNVELSLSLKDILLENGFATAIAPDRKSALGICSKSSFDLALIDIKLPDANGLELVEELSGILPEMEFIVITGYGTIEIAAEAVRKKKIVSFEMKPLDMNRFLLLIRQIRERKNAAEALRLREQELIESEEIHRILLDATKEGIIIFNTHGRVTEVSNITLEIFKAVKKEELTGKRFLDFIPAENRNEEGNNVPEKIKKGILQAFEMTLLRNDGSRFIGELNIRPLHEGQEKTKGYLVVIRDISERKKMEKQLIHTERMAGIGVMAAGMAHEINQPLNNISLTLDNLLLSMNTGSPDKTYLEGKTTKIFNNITRIRKIIDHVRAFSKDHDDYFQSRFDINESIRNAKSMISEQFKHLGIHVVLNLDETVPLPVGNTYKFEQVIVNLIINAKDAILEKEQALKKEFRKAIEISSYVANKCVRVEVKDNGIGIESKDIDKVMLPFYSTKKEGEGTGLGLSISFGIIRDMNGTLEIQSERMTGSMIRIMIPVTEEKAAPVEKKEKKVKDII